MQPPKNIPETDVEKLHAEILQLRNQQFFIGTLALTGSGFALVFLSTLQGDTGPTGTNPIPGVTLLGILAAWFFILGFLFRWSLSLRKLITIISEYLKRATVDVDGKVDGKPASHWEEWYYELSNDKKIEKELNIESQTTFVTWAFIFYGAIAFLISIANCFQYGITEEVKFRNQTLFPVPPEWILDAIIVFFIGYIVAIFWQKFRFDQENKKITNYISTLGSNSKGAESEPQKDSEDSGPKKFVIKSRTFIVVNNMLESKKVGFSHIYTAYRGKRRKRQ